MMLYPPVAELVDKIGSRYQLVNMVARRARQLSEESEEKQIPYLRAFADGFSKKIARGLDISQDALASIEKNFRISRNEFFITAAGLAISLYNDAPNVKISWIFNGREDTTLMTTCGLLFRELPVGFRFKDETNVIDIYADVHEQVQKDIEHSCYPYVEMFAQQGSLETAMATLLYQRDIRDVGGLGGFQLEAVDVRQN